MFPGALKLIFLCLVICLAWTNAAPTTDQSAALQAWEDFVKTYGKTYASDEEYQQRKEQFLKNYASLESKDKQVSLGKTYTTGVTKFSDLSKEEFLKAYTGVVFDESQQSQKSSLPPKKKAVGAPASVDWRTANILSPIRDQGQCGSCWAFAMIGTVEAMYNMKYNALNGSFSEQHLVDCNLSNYGCNGGDMLKALIYLLSDGTATAVSYPYANLVSPVVRNTCKSNLQTSAYKNFAAYYAVNSNDASMQYFISTYGPAAVYIDATPLQSYTGGIIDTACSQINHAVMIVGYETSGPGAPYYILRNSWGSDWGEGGYFRVSASNPCFIKNYAYFGKY